MAGVWIYFEDDPENSLVDLLCDVRERYIKNARRMELLPVSIERPENIANLTCQGCFQKTSEKEKTFPLFQHE